MLRCAIAISAVSLLVIGSPSPVLAQPDAAEQWVVYELNRARWDPDAYRAETGYAIPDGVVPRPPLAVNEQLWSSASFKAWEMFTHSYFAHQSAVTGKWPNRLAKEHGYPIPSSWSLDTNDIETIYGGASPSGLLSTVLSQPTHHVHVLGQTDFYAQHREIGVGRSGDRWAIHTAFDHSANNRLFVTGVVYDDKNGNGRMDLGEGLGGITVELRQGNTVVRSTQTNPGGGYSLPAASATYTVRAWGGGFSEQQVSLTVVENNVTVDFPRGESPIVLQYDSSPQAPAVAMVDPHQARWYLRNGQGQVWSFVFGNPGDRPFMGDWNCNGTKTPGLYRQSDGFVYLRNANTQGLADITFFFGNPGDWPIVGDFNGDGCDTVSIYRPSNQTFYIINTLGANGGGLGAATTSYVFGNPGDKPFVGDFNGNGITTVGLHRESTGFVYYRNDNSTGIADDQFFFGNPGDIIFAGDWNGNGSDSAGLFRPSRTTLYFRTSMTAGNADAWFAWGEPHWIPVYRGWG